MALSGRRRGDGISIDTPVRNSKTCTSGQKGKTLVAAPGRGPGPSFFVTGWTRDPLDGLRSLAFEKTPNDKFSSWEASGTGLRGRLPRPASARRQGGQTIAVEEASKELESKK